MIKNSTNKILALIGFIFINIILLFYVFTQQASAYEINIYGSYPFYFLIFPILAVLSGILIIIRESFSKNVTNWWIIGLIIIIITNLLILALPLVRDYAFYGRSDALTHLGYVLDIINNNRVGLDNYYPISHIFAVLLFYITGINVKVSMMFMSLIYYILFMSSLLLLAKVLAKNRGELLLITAFSAVLMFSYYGIIFFPNYFSLVFIPLVLFLFLKSKESIKNKKNFSFLLIALLILLPLFHEVTSVNLILIFLIMALSVIITAYLNRNHKIFLRKQLIDYKSVITPSIILFIIFFTWFSYFAIFQGTLSGIYNWIFSDIGTSPIADYQTKWSLANINFLQFLNMIFMSFGMYIVYITISLSFTLYMIKKAIMKKAVRFSDIFIVLAFLILSFTTVIFLVGALSFTNPLKTIHFCSSIHNHYFRYGILQTYI